MLNFFVMLNLFIVLAVVVVPFMVWALSSVRKRKSSQVSSPAADTAPLPPVTGGFHLGSSCDAGIGSCDGGGS